MEDSLEGASERPLLGVQREPLSAGTVPGKGSTLGSVCVKAIQETSEIFIFADINGGIPQFAGND